MYGRALCDKQITTPTPLYFSILHLDQFYLGDVFLFPPPQLHLHNFNNNSTAACVGLCLVQL